MNIEQIVKETVAKVVAEKKGKDLNGDGKIDSKDYLQARSNAIEKAKMKNEDHSEDHEVKMAHNSLESIIRSALELKAKIGNQEINIPAWIQDHITNSENYIDQASQGYYKYENNGHESDEIDELQEISDDELAQLQAAADDTSKMPAERDAARNKIYASRAKKELQTLDEITIRRWQHYAGIK